MTLTEGGLPRLSETTYLMLFFITITESMLLLTDPRGFPRVKKEGINIWLLFWLHWSVAKAVFLSVIQGDILTGRRHGVEKYCIETAYRQVLRVTKRNLSWDSSKLVWRTLPRKEDMKWYLCIRRTPCSVECLFFIYLTYCEFHIHTYALLPFVRAT